MDGFIGLFWWVFLGLIVYFFWYRGSRPSEEKKEKISPLTVIFAVLLTIIVISFFTLVWEDIGSLATGGIPLWKFILEEEKADILFESILYHTGFVVPVVVLALMLYFSLYKKGSQYSAMIVPYLIGSLFMVLRLLFDIGTYIIKEYRRAGIYIVVGVLMIVFSAIVFFVQQKWEERKRKDNNFLN